MIKGIEVTVEVDLDAFTDEELCEELQARGLGAVPSRAWEELADFVARGETREALELIKTLSGGFINVTLALHLATIQMINRNTVSAID